MVYDVCVGFGSYFSWGRVFLGGYLRMLFSGSYLHGEVDFGGFFDGFACGCVSGVLTLSNFDTSCSIKS